jgi:hypothetical protein
MKKEHLLFGGAILAVIIFVALWEFLWAVGLAVVIALGFVYHWYRRGGGR